MPEGLIGDTNKAAVPLFRDTNMAAVKLSHVIHSTTDLFHNGGQIKYSHVLKTLLASLR